MVHSTRSFSSRTWFTIGVIGLILLVGFAFVREYVRNSDIASELARMESENAALSTQRSASLQLIAQLSTETAVEADAREKLNLAQEGETMYVVEDGGGTDETDSEADVTDINIATDPGLSNPVKWFYYFFASAVVHESVAL